MNNLIQEINNRLDEIFGNGNVIFTNKYSLLFVKDTPLENEIDEAVEIVNQFMEWEPYYDKAHSVSFEYFQKQADKIKYGY